MIDKLPDHVEINKENIPEILVILYDRVDKLVDVVNILLEEHQTLSELVMNNLPEAKPECPQSPEKEKCKHDLAYRTGKSVFCILCRETKPECPQSPDGKHKWHTPTKRCGCWKFKLPTMCEICGVEK